VTPEDRNAPLPVTREAKSVGFTNISRRPDTGVDFTELIERVGAVNPNMRVRFTSPHPKDFPMDLIEVIKNNPNICNNLHMPLQSGSTDVLKSMRRGYTQEAYLQLVQAVRERIPDITISTDIIAGFCGETDQDHKETIYTMQQVGYDVAYMFKYSQRAKTHAHRKMEDDVPEKVKGARLTEIIKQFQGQHREKLHTYKGSTQLVLVDGHSVKHPDQLVGRTDGNKRVIFPDMPLPVYGSEAPAQAVQMGDYVVVKVVNTEKALRGEPSYIADVPSFAANAELHQ
jgi:MiaB/RimO family radical SAM methylthiotransferase